MTSEFEGKVITPYVEKLNEEVRRQVQSQQGQLLVVPSVSKIRYLLGDVPQVSDEQIETAYALAIKKAKSLEDSYTSGKGKARKEILEQRKDQIKFQDPELKFGVNVFLVSNFRTSINLVRNTIFSNLGLTEDVRKKVLATIQKGHGEAGLAVAQVQVAETLASIDEKDLQNVIKEFNRYVEDVNNSIDLRQRLKYKDLIKQIESGYLSLVTNSGEIIGNYFSIVTLQSSFDNQADKQIEQEFVKTFRSFMSNKYKDIINMKNSPSLKTKLEAFYTIKFTGGIKKDKRVKVTSTKNLPKLGKKDSGSSTKKYAKKKDPKVIKKTNIRKAAVKKVEKPSSINLNALKAQINSRLSLSVIKNMGTPALENRSGRFARSAQVTDVIQTSQGFPSIGYTYQKFPYQTFELGFKQGSSDRDPRVLIDKSIREIASELIVGRFYTRRV